MQNPVAHIISGQTFWVYPERCLWWEEENTLIVADTHLGKTGHFRKSGIAVPQDIYKADLQRLMTMITRCQAERLLIVGDFSHSRFNRELDLFMKWRRDLPGLQIDLIRGNHDILEEDWYTDAAIRVHEERLMINGFNFRHDPQDKVPPETEPVRYSFTAHVHPGIILRGTARQTLKFPCFYFARDYCILPAFSRFTGTYTVRPEKGETVYAISANELIRIG
ncbi:MAG: ligase-associated DNA damage response endonuclease PdeM [Chitinophagaceae bacterium]